MTSRVYFLSLPPSHLLIGFIGIRKPAIRHLGLSMDERNIVDDVIQHRGEDIMSSALYVSRMFKPFFNNSLINQLGYFILPPKKNLRIRRKKTIWVRL